MNLWFYMIEHMGLIVAIAFILTRIATFRNLIDHKLDRRTIIKQSIVFGLFGIFGTYTGISVSPSDVNGLFWMPRVDQINVNEALANSRVVGVVSGGLLGGPWVGLGAGLIAGLHRVSLGGFTAVACGISTVAEGLIAGFFYTYLRNRRIISLEKAFMAGVIAESVQMVIILIVAKPFANALALVKLIGFPMIFANSVGIVIFVAIIHSVVREEDRIEADQAQKILHIADQMLVHLRKGLNQKSATEISKLLLKSTGVSAVSITDHEQILSHVGLGDDHHLAGHKVLTEATKKALASGELYIPKSLPEIHCPKEGCPLAVAIIVPLKKAGEVVGVLKFYFSNPKQIKPVDKELAQGLGKLLSHQIEVVEAQNQAELVREAEIKALQAQINPHFLFNSLNTIVALIRKQPDMARKLLIQLGFFFRQNLNASTYKLVSITQELDHTRAYLDIEQARFAERLSVQIEQDEIADQVRIPPLTLQPLVENSIRHGLKEHDQGGIIRIKVTLKDRKVRISVTDNGLGIPADRIKELLYQRVESNEGTGLGLYNVNQRLTYLFGEDAGLRVESKLGEGSCVWFEIPMEERGQESSDKSSGGR